MKLPSNYKFLFFLILLIFVFFWKFFILGKIPIPADTILGMYHPWRDVVWDGFTAGVPYKNFLITDPVRQQYLWKKLSIDSWKSFNFPLWNNYTHSGMPLLADFQSAAFYPLNLILFVFSFDIGWGLFILLQPVLGLFFMYLFLRNQKLNFQASLTGGMVFAFSGFAAVWLEWGNIVHTYLWLPLIFYLIDKILKTPSKILYFLLLFSLISQFFAGHLQVFSYCILMEIIYLIYRLKNIKGFKINQSLPFLIVFVLFVLITSIQWLPTWELISLSAREADQANVLLRPDWFLPPKHLIGIIVPDFFGNPATGNYWGEWNYLEFACFIGFIPFLMVILSLFNFKKNKQIKFFAISALIILSFALPTPWAKLPYGLKIPFWDTTQPSRLLSLFIFCLSVLAGFGWQKLEQGKKIKKELIISLLFSLVIFSGLWFLVLMAKSGDFLINLAVIKRNLILPTVIFLSASFLMILLLIIKSKIINQIILGLLFLLLVFDFYRFFSKFNSFSPIKWIFPYTETLNFLKKDRTDFRYMTTDRRIMPPNFSIAYHLSTIDGYDPLYSQNYGKLISKIETNSGEMISFNRIIQPGNFNSGLVDKLNVKYVISLNDLESEKLEEVFREGQTIIYQNKNFQQRYQLTDNETSNILLLPSKPNSQKLIITNSNNSRLLISQMYFPGWKAKVNGEKAEVEIDENNFPKINLKPGENLVEFYYEPKSFKIGLILLSTGLILGLIIIGISKK